MKFYSTYFSVKSRSFRESIVRHEVGHALMFRHVSDPSCVMWKWMDSADVKYDNIAKPLCGYERKLFLRYYGGKEGP